MRWSPGVVRAATDDEVLLELQLAAHLLIAERAFGLQLAGAGLVVGFLVLELDDLEAVLAVLELVFVRALLDVVLEHLWDLDVLRAELAGSDEPALPRQVQVVQVLVLELAAEDPAELAAQLRFLPLHTLYLAYLVVDVLFHRHQYHRVQLLAILQDPLFPKHRSQIRSHVVGSVLLRQCNLLLQKYIDQEIHYFLPLPNFKPSEAYLLQNLQFLDPLCKRVALIISEQPGNEELVAHPVEQHEAILEGELKELFVLFEVDILDNVVEDAIVGVGEGLSLGVGVIFVEKDEYFQCRGLEVGIEKFKIEVKEHKNGFFELRINYLQFFNLVPEVDQSLIMILFLV